jgi:tRNA1Val (adenine37-N6)-methyltransferase
MEQMLREGERLDDLLVDNLRIIQDSSAFRFSIDAVLLSHFATVKPGDQVLDLGTGSGVIPLLLSTREPRLQLVGVELNPTVAERARRSVRLNNLQEKIQIITGDLRELGTLLPGYQATLVVSNPPYQPLGTG